jgi:RHS repeat-associated protein
MVFWESLDEARCSIKGRKQATSSSPGGPGDGAADRAVLYGPYGEQKTTTAEDDVRFATYMRDSVTGLDYAMNRYYSSIIGRFLSPDPSMNNVDYTNPSTWARLDIRQSMESFRQRQGMVLRAGQCAHQLRGDCDNWADSQSGLHQ